jgi:hypothetical protein
MLTTASSGEEPRAFFAPCSATLVFEQLVGRVGKAFRLANADLFRMECHDYAAEMAELAALLRGFGRRVKPHLHKSKDSDALLDLLAMLALPRGAPLGAAAHVGALQGAPLGAAAHEGARPGAPLGAAALEGALRGAPLGAAAHVSALHGAPLGAAAHDGARQDASLGAAAHEVAFQGAPLGAARPGALRGALHGAHLGAAARDGALPAAPLGAAVHEDPLQGPPLGAAAHEDALLGALQGAPLGAAPHDDDHDAAVGRTEVAPTSRSIGTITAKTIGGIAHLKQLDLAVERLRGSFEGHWIPCSSADEPPVGRCIRSREPVLSIDRLGLMLPCGSTGLVTRVDDDGDIYVTLPCLRGEVWAGRCSSWFSWSDDFSSFEVLQEESSSPMGGLPPGVTANLIEFT